MTEQPTPEQVREKIASAVPMTPNPEPVAQADLVEWLRSWKPGDQHSYCDTAATEIERLRAEIARKDEALREYGRLLLPVAMTIAEHDMCDTPLADEATLFSFMGSGASDSTTVGDFRKAEELARAALAKLKGSTDDGR